MVITFTIVYHPWC